MASTRFSRTTSTAASKKTAATASHPAFAEPLEGRTLFAANVALAAGTLTVTGTAGTDDVYISYQAAGNKILVQQRIGSSYQVTNTYANGTIKKVVANLGKGNDNFVLGDNVKNVTLTADGGDGDDHLTGGVGNDVLKGGNGNDYIDAGRGDDLIDGGLGRDTMFGSFGIDTVDYSSRTAGIKVTLDYDYNDGAPGEGDYVDNDDVETVLGGKGNDVITGNALANTLVGGAGNDTLNGLAGDDVLRGGDGNDVLTGGAGKDKLYGDAGNDTFYAKSSPADADTVDGGAGTDKAQKDSLDKLTLVESVLP